MLVRSPRALVLVAALSSFALPVLAAGEDPVVAVVNGKEIHRSALLEAQASIPQARGAPLDKIYDQLLEQVIASELVLAEAKKAKIENDPKVKEAFVEAQNSIMRRAWLAKKVDADVTEAQVKAKYDELLKTAQPEEQVHARHILVDSEDAAKAVLADLKSGVSFEDEAKAKSKDPSGKTNGGDLGYITKGETVPEFSEAAFKLKPGEITQVPVKSQFGWHIIKVEDRRMAPPPSFDEAKNQVRQQMEQQDVMTVIAALKKTATVKRFKIDGTPEDGPAPTAAAAPAKK
jgi:peptidyl-prolyl cis-trans isomerase C